MHLLRKITTKTDKKLRSTSFLSLVGRHPPCLALCQSTTQALQHYRNCTLLHHVAALLIGLQSVPKIPVKFVAL